MEQTVNQGVTTDNQQDPAPAAQEQQAQPEQPAAPAAPEEKTFTQSEVNAMIRNRAREELKKAEERADKLQAEAIKEYAAPKYPAVKDGGEVKPVPYYKIGLYKVKASILNIRKESSADSIDVGDLYKNSIVSVDEVKDGWGHISGWCKLSYCQEM